MHKNPPEDVQIWTAMILHHLKAQREVHAFISHTPQAQGVYRLFGANPRMTPSATAVKTVPRPQEPRKRGA